ncbi:MAG: VTT domain-containing protein [Kurthia sp.]
MDIQIIDYLQQPTLQNALLSFLLLILLSFIPFIPMPAIYGALAFTFPMSISIFISLSGSVIGAITMYMLCRTALKGYYKRRLQSWEQSHPFIQLMRTNAFSAILLGRLIPIFPSAVLNTIAGVFQIRFWPFALATTLGKIPTILMFTFTGKKLMEQNYTILFFAFLYIVLLASIAWSIKANWKKTS